MRISACKTWINKQSTKDSMVWRWFPQASLHASHFPELVFYLPQLQIMTSSSLSSHSIMDEVTEAEEREWPCWDEGMSPDREVEPCLVSSCHILPTHRSGPAEEGLTGPQTRAEAKAQTTGWRDAHAVKGTSLRPAGHHWTCRHPPSPRRPRHW